MTVVFLLALAPATAQAATQTRDELSDAPDGTLGRADLRSVSWDVAGSAAKLTIGLDASTYQECNPGCVDQRAQIAVHVLLDTDGDGIADAEAMATRDADGVAVDAQLRSLDRTLSTADCQDLAGDALGVSATLASSVAGGIETFTFSFDPTVLPGALAAFRWAAFAQAPPDASAGGPWDYLPDSTNPDLGAANPGDRRCDASHSGLRVRMGAGVAFPDAAPAPEPAPDPTPAPAAVPTPEPTPASDTTKPSLGALSLSRTRFRVGTTVSYVLSEPAVVRFHIEAARRGHYKLLRGSFARAGHAGSNSFKFRGRLRGRKLGPGRYRLLGVATDRAGNTSRLKRIRFQIIRRSTPGS
jgi:hypothetical protein